MKRFILWVITVSILALCYVGLQVKIIEVSYEIRRAYLLKEKLLCRKEFYMARLLSMSSPDRVEQGLLERRICLGYASPRKVVRLDHSKKRGGRKPGIWSVLFGMPQAAADVIE